MKATKKMNESEKQVIEWAKNRGRHAHLLGIVGAPACDTLLNSVLYNHCDNTEHDHHFIMELFAAWNCGWHREMFAEKTETCELLADDVANEKSAGFWYRAGHGMNICAGRELITDSDCVITDEMIKSAGLVGPFKTFSEALDLCIADYRKMELEKINIETPAEMVA